MIKHRNRFVVSCVGWTEMCSGSEAGPYLRLTFVLLNSRPESNKQEEEERLDESAGVGSLSASRMCVDFL
jgi:hypothetical protein